MALLMSNAVANEADYMGLGVFGGNGSRGFDRNDINYEEYDTGGITFKAGLSEYEYQSIEASVSLLGTNTALNNFVLFAGVDVDYIITPYQRQKKFFTPFISLGLGSYHFNGDTDNNNTTYDETEGIAFNGKVGVYIKMTRHLEIEAHMHGKSFLWNSSENDTGDSARREADSMTNFYLGLNWHL